MKLHIRYFASLRETIGQSHEQIDTQVATVGEVRSELLARGGAYACLGRDKSLRMALNQVMADESALILESSDLAFFPPVTGG